MFIDHYREKGLRRDEAQNCSGQTHLENTPKHSVLVHFEGCLEPGIAVLSNTIQRNHSLQHFTRGGHREGGEQEVRRRILQQNVSVSYCTEKELYLNLTCIMDVRTPQALTRERPSTILASTENLVAVERTSKLVVVKLTSGSKDCAIGPSKSKITSARKQSKSSRSVASRLEAKSRVQSIQRAVEGNDLQHGKHGVLRDLRDHSQSTVPQLYDTLDEKHCILYLRNMLAALRQNSKIEEGSP